MKKGLIGSLATQCIFEQGLDTSTTSLQKIPQWLSPSSPLPIQEYLGEMNIIYKGDEPVIDKDYHPGSFLEELKKVDKS